MRKTACTVVAALGLAVVPAAAAGLLTLHPTGFGQEAFSAWRAHEGLPDTVGEANQALLLRKATFDPATAAAAVFVGFEGVRAQALAGLEWERRVTGDCNLTSPRWDLVVQGRSGRRYLVRFGCRGSVHLPGSAPGWIRDVNPRELIRARLLAAGGREALAGTIVSLAIVFDDRDRFGFVYLDNIKVLSSAGSGVWTSAADNAEAVPGAPEFVHRDLVANPFHEFEILTLEELWPRLTPEEQDLATTDAAITDE